MENPPALPGSSLATMRTVVRGGEYFTALSTSWESRCVEAHDVGLNAIVHDAGHVGFQGDAAALRGLGEIAPHLLDGGGERALGHYQLHMACLHAADLQGFVHHIEQLVRSV